MNITDAIDLADGREVIASIRSTLKGPVLLTVRELVPELAGIPRQSAYDHAIGDIDLLHRCFGAFRAQRERFRHLLVDAQGRAVDSDTQTLACGRTLEEVVAMIVRTAARRYFRRTLDGPRAGRMAQATARPAGLAARVAAMLGRPTPPARPPARPQRPSAGDELYEAIKPLLRYDWQLPLVPDYARLHPHEVRRMGEGLLAVRDARALMAVLQGAPAAPPPAPARGDAQAAPGATAAPLPSPVEHQRRPERVALLANILTVDGKRLRGAAFTAALLSPEVRAVLPNGDHAVHLTGVLGSVAGQAAATLVDRLGLTMAQLAVLLLLAYEAVGSDTFLRVFGTGADRALVERLAHQAQLAGIGPATPLAEIGGFVAAAFARLRAASLSHSA